MIRGLTVVFLALQLLGCPDQEGVAADVAAPPMEEPTPALVDQCQPAWERQDRALDQLEATVDGLEAIEPPLDEEGPPYE